MGAVKHLLLVLVLVSAMTSSLACSKSKKQSMPADDLLKESGTAVTSVRSFHFRLNHENGGTPMPLNLQLISADGEVGVPDRLAADVKAKASSVTASIKVISVGEKTWITNPFSRRWQLLPGAGVRDIADPTALMTAILNGISDPRVVGSPEIDNVKTYEIAGSLDAGALKTALITAQQGHTLGVQLWIGVNDLLPRKARIEGPIADGESPNIVRELEFSRFNDTVNILPPE
jgi:LppX_LprAFG lipoprotein